MIRNRRLGSCLIFFFLSQFVQQIHAQSPSLDSTVRFDYLSGDTIPTRKEIFRYDDLHRETELIVQVRKLHENSWQNDRRTTTSYAGEQIDTITEWQYATNSFVPSQRTFTEINEDTTWQTSQTWMPMGWVNESNLKEVRKAGMVVYRLYFRWSGDAWQKSDSVAILYNQFNLIASDTQYVRIPLFNVFLPNSYSLRHYDDQNQLTEHRRFEYHADSMRFLRRSRDTFAYDQDGFQLLAQFDLWLASKGSWDTSLKIVRTKNQLGLLDSSKILFQNFVSGKLEPTSRLEHTYYGGPDGRGPDTVLLRVKNIAYQGPFEVPDWKRWHYYSLQSTSGITTPGYDIQVYPNPASNVIYIQATNGGPQSYRLLSPQGQLMAAGLVKQNQIRLPTFTASAYYVLQLIDRTHRTLVPKIIFIQ